MSRWFRAVWVLAACVGMLAGCESEMNMEAGEAVDYIDVEATPAQVRDAVAATLTELNLTSPPQTVMQQGWAEPVGVTRGPAQEGLTQSQSRVPQFENVSAGSLRVMITPVAPGVTRLTVQSIPEPHPGISQAVLDRVQRRLTNSQVLP